MTVACFVRHDGGDRQQRQAQIADLDQHPVQRGLVDDWPVEIRLAVRFVAER
jgi:hypothetical protein